MESTERLSRPNGDQQLNKTISHKLVLLGSSAVGKSSLVLRFVHRQFHEYEAPTIGDGPLAAFVSQTISLDDVTVKFDIWDTAGQEQFHSLTPMYYRGAPAAIIVYDITMEDTFARAKTWVKEVRQATPNVILALAGNKADLSEEQRTVSYEEVESYAEENGLLFMETSAKTAQNVNNIFIELAKKLPKESDLASSSNQAISLQSGSNMEGSRARGCC